MKKQGGFTLVELAIALMVIGLLIGGVLKGQELIDNARITRTVKDISDYNTAVMIFQSTYSALPGDIKRPSRIPNCTETLCMETGDHNKQIGNHVGSSEISLVYDHNLIAREARRFWIHLTKAGMISSIIDTSYTGTPNVAGIDFPKTPYGSFLFIAYLDPNPGFDDELFPFGDQRGHYFAMLSAVTNLRTGNAMVIPVQSAARMDSKIDDGKALTGKVRSGMGTSCANSDNTDYATSPGGKCSVTILAEF